MKLNFFKKRVVDLLMIVIWMQYSWKNGFNFKNFTNEIRCQCSRLWGFIHKVSSLISTFYKLIKISNTLQMYTYFYFFPFKIETNVSSHTVFLSSKIVQYALQNKIFFSICLENCRVFHCLTYFSKSKTLIIFSVVN